MSHAYDRIVEVLDRQQPDGWRYNRVLAGRLLPIVRDTVAKGFRTAADILEHPDPDGRSASELLRQFAQEATADGPVEG